MSNLQSQLKTFRSELAKVQIVEIDLQGKSLRLAVHLMRAEITAARQNTCWKKITDGFVAIGFTDALATTVASYHNEPLSKTARALMERAKSSAVPVRADHREIIPEDTQAVERHDVRGPTVARLQLND